MFLCKSALCAMALFLTTGCDASFKDADLMIKIPDECKGQHLCTIKPEGYHHLEAKIESWLPKYLKNAVNVTKMDLQPRIGEIEQNSDNCQEKMENGDPYIYFHTESNSTEYEIVIQSERLKQEIKVVKCEKLESPISPDSKQQCFRHLNFKTADLESLCETIFAQRPLFVFDKKSGKIIQKHVNLPVACSCMVSIP